MNQKSPPETYESLIHLIHNRYDEMSATYKQIAVYLTQNPNDVAVRSVTAIAQICDIHASSFVRFAQSLGYDGFKSLQAMFRQRLATAAPGFEARVHALEEELKSRDELSEAELLRDMIISDAASIQSGDERRAWRAAGYPRSICAGPLSRNRRRISARAAFPNRPAHAPE